MAERSAGGRKVKKPPAARPPKAKRKPATKPRTRAGETSPEALAALRADEELTELIAGLALSARFHFYLLIADTPRLTSAILEILATDVPKARGEPARIVRIDPYRDHTPPSAPIAFERLIQEVLARLVDLAPEERDPEVILVVDASRALPHDHDAWMRFFMRLNERRNLIIQQLRGPLLLVLPGWLEPVFAHAAPDFWSIRSLAVVVEAPASLFPAPPAAKAERIPPARAEHGPAPAGETAALEAEIARTRAKLTDHPADDSALMALNVLLDRQSTFEGQHGSLDRALATAEESLALARQRLASEPESSDRLRNLSISLNKSGDVHRAQGKLDRADEAYNESLALARRLLERAPESAQALRDLSVSLDRIGDVRRDRGDLPGAVEAYSQSLALARRLLERAPESAEALRDLSASLERIGDVRRDRGDLPGAVEAYSEDLALARRLLERAPESAQALRDLSVSLSKIGDVHRDRGDLPGAVEAYNESLALRRRLLERAPESAQALRDLSISLSKIGDVHSDRGDLPGAFEAYNESLALGRRLLERDPQNPSRRYDLALSLGRRALLAVESDRPHEGLSLVRQAGAELDALVQLPSPLPRWVELANLCRAEIARLEAALAPKPKHRPSTTPRNIQGDRPAQNPPKPKRRRA